MVYFLAHVTSQALVDHQFVEMESYGITKDVFILPRGRKIVQSQMEYFCLTGKLNFYSADTYISHTLYPIIWLILKNSTYFLLITFAMLHSKLQSEKVQSREVRSCTIHLLQSWAKRLFLEKIYLHYLLQSFSVFSLTLQYCEKLSCTRRQSSSLRYYVVVTYI